MPIDPGLRRLALRTLLAAFAGPDPRRTGRCDLLGEGLAGHTLFGNNIADPVQVAAPDRRPARRRGRTC